MPLLTLLNLAPLKDWLYCGVIAVLLIAFGWYTHHERAIGAAKVVAGDEKAVAVKVQSNQKGEANAQAGISAAVDVYDLRIGSAVTAPVPHLVCEPTRDSGPLSGRSGSPSAGDDSAPAEGVLPRSSGKAFDPAPAVVADADEADRLAAELALAQDTIRAYQKQGVVQK